MDIVKLRGIAAKEMYKHGLQSWTFILTDTGRRLGRCHPNLSRIEISDFYARNNPESHVLDTLMHEIAHALTPGHGHDSVWKAKAIELGATPCSCDQNHDTQAKPGDWQAKCPTCQKVHHKYRRPKKLSGWRCRCAARTALTFVWAGNPALRPIDPPPPTSVVCWQVKCPGCGYVHKKKRRPTGQYRCKCKHRSILPPWQHVRISLPPK